MTYHVKKGDVVKYVGTPPSSNWSVRVDEYHLRKFKSRKINGIVIEEPFEGSLGSGEPNLNQRIYTLNLAKVLLGDKIYTMPISWLMAIPEGK